MISTAPATRSRGNSSRMIPNARGKIPPAAPCTTRPSSMIASEPASADTVVATHSRARTTTSNRFLPYMSPSRPIAGVAIEALSRYAVRTQLTASTEVCRACWMSGSAGATSDCSSAYDTPASASSANVTL
jgi:hypothetical protein